MDPERLAKEEAVFAEYRKLLDEKEDENIYQKLLKEETPAADIPLAIIKRDAEGRLGKYADWDFGEEA